MTFSSGFIGRQEELACLEGAYRQRESQFIVVYGRRRVGKSTLLARFCKDKYHIFFTGRKAESQAGLFDRILKYLGDFFQNPLIARLRVNEWGEIFEIIDRERKNKKIIIVFDEFQWMCDGRNTIISALQEHWDKKWKNDGRIFLALCGSIISFMQRSVLSEKSPLYGRRTKSLEIEAMFAPTARLFFPKMGCVEQGEIIFTLGGIPSYLELIKPKESFAQNINRLALTKNGYLVDEAQFILREQLKSPKRYYLLLKFLSQRSMSREELAGAMGINNSGALNLYLKTLSDLQLVKLLTPIDKGETSKTQRYIIWDEFLRFYFSFILPNKELISMNTDDWLYDRIIAPSWDSYCGRSFELFCMKNIKAIISLLGIKDVFKRSGTYWQKKTARKEGVQIDMIIERTDGVTHLIECKWSRGKIGTPSIEEEMRRKKQLYPNSHNHTLKMALITTHGVTDKVKQSGVLENIITLKDILMQ